MNTTEAKTVVEMGRVVKSTVSSIQGQLVGVTEDGWGVVRDATGRVDEEKVERLVVARG